MVDCELQVVSVGDRNEDKRLLEQLVVRLVHNEKPLAVNLNDITQLEMRQRRRAKEFSLEPAVEVDKLGQILALPNT